MKKDLPDQRRQKHCPVFVHITSLHVYASKSAPFHALSSSGVLCTSSILAYSDVRTQTCVGPCRYRLFVPAPPPPRRRPLSHLLECPFAPHTRTPPPASPPTRGGSTARAHRSDGRGSRTRTILAGEAKSARVSLLTSRRMTSRLSFSSSPSSTSPAWLESVTVGVR